MDVREYVEEYGPQDVQCDMVTIGGAWNTLTVEQKYARAFAAARYLERILGSFPSSDLGTYESNVLLGGAPDDGEEDDLDDDDS